MTDVTELTNEEFNLFAYVMYDEKENMMYAIFIGTMGHFRNWLKDLDFIKVEYAPSNDESVRVH